MPEPSTCIVPECGRNPAPDAPFPICLRHVARVMEFVRERQMGPLNADELEYRNRQARLALEESQGVVYYVRVGELIKIGTTRQHVYNRLSDLPPDRQVLATEPGGFTLERTRHRQFRLMRAQSGREWFHPSPELWRHIEGIRNVHGVPEEFPVDRKLTTL